MIESERKIYEIPLTEIFCDHDFNCRGMVSERDCDDLTRSIDAYGLEAPIVVQEWNGQPGKKYRIVSGHRRFTSFRVLMKHTIPCMLKEKVDELEARRFNLEENLKRKDLNIQQEANALKFFVNSGWSRKEIADEFSQTGNWVDVRLALLSLPDDIQLEAAAGFLNQTHIIEISKVLKRTNNREKVDEAIRKIKLSKQLGEKRRIPINEPKVKPFSKTHRSRAEIFELMNVVQESKIGNFIGTRFLAWAAGEITLMEIYKDLEAYAKEQSIDFQIPEAVVTAARAA